MIASLETAYKRRRGMMKKLRILTLIVVGLAALICIAGWGPPGCQTLPRIISATWDIDENNSLIVDFEVEVNVPSEVYVHYETDGVETLRSRMTPTGEYYPHSAQFSVVRLRPETTYSFKVFARDRWGRKSRPAKGTFTTDPLPEALQSLEINLIKGQTSHPLTVFDQGSLDFNGFVAIEEGEVVWYFENPDSARIGDFDQLPNGNFIFDGYPTETNREIRMFNALGLESDYSPSPTLCDQNVLEGGSHHEMIPHNGKVIYLGREMREDSFGDLQIGDTIRRWDPATGEDVLLWSLFDYFDPTLDKSDLWRVPPQLLMPYCVGPAESNNNWTHANSLAIGTQGNLIMSVRYFDGIISIEAEEDAHGGDLVLGGLQWVLAARVYNPLPSAPENTPGEPCKFFEIPDREDRFYRQHSARQLPNGNILLFDNGFGRPGEEGGHYSRALELELDPSTCEAHAVWSYPAIGDTSLFAWAVSNVVRLENGNTLIHFGADGMPPPSLGGTLRIVEVSEGGEVNAQIEIRDQDKRLQYRAHPLDSLYGEAFVK
jgi:hypothetical protein